MKRTFEAVYRKGVLAPLEPLDLPEEQKVRVTVELRADSSAREALSAWEDVLGGLSGEEVVEFERIALDRSRFMRPAR